ncbi:unnamed protein product [Ambrosiozyma monospora]|uniref:Unnamed protein product n=1 Tax=Ambrosiozyma monospora TaxID=43982 RepID=A0A9W6YRK3_AMBMO|nr:unnamed protein product [Ambrosiozyma monospora]
MTNLLTCLKSSYYNQFTSAKESRTIKGRWVPYEYDLSPLSDHNETNTLSKKFINSLVTLSKKELENRDLFGRTILHIICIANRYDLLTKLLKNINLDLTITDIENNWNCLHFAIFNKNFTIARILLNTKNCDVLMKAKDREGFTPVDLLSSESELSKLIWIPESLGTFREDSNKNNSNSRKIKRDKKEELPVWLKHDNGLPKVEPIIKQMHLQQRFDAERIPMNFARSTNLGYDEDRGGSQLYVSGFLDSARDVSSLGFVKIDSRKLKLGYGDSKKYPIMSERISLPRIRDFKMSKYHSIILTSEAQGNIFVHGSGNKGRLGLGNNQTQDKYVPVPSFSNSKIKCVDISDHHSIVLDSSNRVYTWGMNNFGQLGYSIDGSGGSSSDQVDPFNMVPRQVVQGDFKKSYSDKFVGVACSKFHSLAYSRSKIYLWGFNIGQFGFSSGDGSASSGTKGLVQYSPRIFEFKYGEIKQVCATDSSTIVLNDSDEIHIYLNGFHAKVLAPLLNKIDDMNFNSFRPRLLTKKKRIVKLVTEKNAKVCLMLYDNGDVVQFNMDTDSRNALDFNKNLKFITVWKASKQHLRCTDVDMSNDGSILICVKDGSAYKRTKRSSSANNIVSKRYKFSKILKLNKVVRVMADPSFEKFGFIRDDIDLIPHQIAKNSVIRDFAKFSPIVELEDRHLQKTEIVDQAHAVVFDKKDTFKANYVHKIERNRDNEEVDDFEFYDEDMEKAEMIDASDKLYINHITRWNAPAEVTDHYLAPSDSGSTRELLKEDDLDYWLELKELHAHKYYDGSVLVKDTKSGHHFSFGAHFGILTQRSPTFEKVIGGSAVFEKDGIRVEKVSNKMIMISGNVTLRAVAIALHFIYTDMFMDVWFDFPIGKVPTDVQRTRVAFDSLARILKIVNPMGRTMCRNTLLQDLLDVMNKCSANDTNRVRVELKDGHLFAYKPLLISRSVYFETLFSGTWNDANCNVAALPDINVKIFNIILRYLSGVDLNEMLNGIDDITDINSFIELVLELMSAAEQLMLTNLSEICQLYIKDFISLDNVDIILLHAYQNKAKNLMENCLWYLYYNMNVLLFEPSFQELIDSNLEEGDELLKIIDGSFKWFDSLKHYKNTDVSSQAKFIETCSNRLIKEFLRTPELFDDHFLHPFSLHCLGPFYDLAKDSHKVISESSNGKISSNQRRRRSSAKRIEEIKANVPGSSEIFRPKSQSIHHWAAMNGNKDDFNQSAIIDNDDEAPGADDFQVVTNKKRTQRRSSSHTKVPLAASAGLQNHATTAFMKQDSPPYGSPPTSSASTLRTPSSAQSKSPYTPYTPFTPSATPIKITTASPTARFISIEESLASAKPSSARAPPIIAKVSSSNKTRLSQRERKLKQKEQEEQQKVQEQKPSVSKEPVAPWASYTPPTTNNSGGSTVAPPWASKSSWGAPSSALSNLFNPSTSNSAQIIGSSSQFYNLSSNVSSASNTSAVKETTPPPQSSSMTGLVPSFEYVLMEEQMKKASKDQSLIPDLTSLDDIRQEEEFAKWWAEESAKVQNELNINESPSSGISKSDNHNEHGANRAKNNKNRRKSSTKQQQQQQQQRKGSSSEGSSGNSKAKRIFKKDGSHDVNSNEGGNNNKGKNQSRRESNGNKTNGDNARGSKSESGRHRNGRRKSGQGNGHAQNKNGRQNPTAGTVPST